MQPQVGYQPFLIGEGISKTGLFSYLDSWVKPQDAFDTLLNAYVYRGSIYMREGMTLYPSATQSGALVYQNNEIVATGNGGTVGYAGTLTNFPLIGTVTIKAKTAAGVRSSTATFGAGDISWSTGGASLATAGKINFTTGAWTLTSSSNIANNVPITIQYNYVPTLLTSNAGKAVNNPIMGIKQFINETAYQNILVVMDTRRASFWDSGTSSFKPLASFQQTFFQFPIPNTQVATNSGVAIKLQWPLIAPYSVTIKTFSSAGVLIDTTTDSPTNSTTGTIVASGNISGGAITYDDGAGDSDIIVTFGNPAANNAGVFVQITASLQNDYFTGNNTNFFNATNWDAPEIPAFLYMTNNVDFITLFNGTFLSRPAFALYKNSVTLSAPSKVLVPFHNDIFKALDVKVFQNSLIIIRPTIIPNGTNTPNAFAENQSIYYSCPSYSTSFLPWNFVLETEIAGNGGFVSAPTGDFIQAAQLLRDGLVCFFNNSTWFFRATNNSTIPFIFTQLNTSRSTNAPYGSIAYDVFCTSMGAKGLIACDGVGVERYDQNVIDLFLDINQNAFGQCFAQKYDSLNQSWMLYPSTDNDNSTSDKAIIYNFLENNWSIFQPNLGQLVQTPAQSNTLSCLGLGFTSSDTKWSDYAANSGSVVAGQNWSQANYSWISSLEQDLSPQLLAGDQNGLVYVTNDGTTDNGNAIKVMIQTKRLNPFIGQLGTKASFGYLDVYYEVNPSITCTIKFYGNNSEQAYKSTTFTFDCPTNAQGNMTEVWSWKRFYVNITGEFLQIEINSQTAPDDQTYQTAGSFKILGMILWASPAGRLTPGVKL